jgi:pimeloyl-ACP methyl ester carboxylesterase
MHGGGQTRHSWAGAQEKLAAEGYRVVSYDARGHGESGWAPDGDYSVDTLALDLMAVLDGQARPRALVGASMGGITAFYAVGSRSDAVADAMILVDIVLRPAKEGAAKILAFMRANPDGFATMEEAVEAVIAYNPERPRPTNYDGLRRNLRERSGRLYWHWDPKLIEGHTPSEPPDMAERAIKMSGRVTIPTLLIRGGRSDVVDDAGVAELKVLVPQTEVFEVASAGHMVAGDDNTNFHGGIIRFLRRHMPVKR